MTSAPKHYTALLQPIPEDVVLSTRISSNVQIWHFFTTSYAKLEKALPRMMNIINQDGAIWVSWPKKASGVKTDMTEGRIRDAALPLGLVDIKVCAVDETWSGLKLVIRKELRTSR